MPVQIETLESAKAPLPIPVRSRRSEKNPEVSEESADSDIQITGEWTPGEELLKFAKVKLEESEASTSAMEQDEQPSVDKGKAKAVDVSDDSIQICDDHQDSSMRSLSPEQPAYGSSRATGGFMRGGRDHYNFADNRDPVSSAISNKCMVQVYISSNNPSTIITSMKPQYGLAMRQVWESMCPLLEYLAERIPIICQASSEHGALHSILCWDAENDFWSPLGTYEDVILDDDFELFELCDIQKNFPNLQIEGKSLNVRIGIQRYEALESAEKVWAAKKLNRTWPAPHAHVTAQHIHSIWYEQAAWFGWKKLYTDLVTGKLTNAAHGDTLDWLRARASGEYSQSDLKKWISGKAEETAKAQKTLAKSFVSSSSSKGLSKKKTKGHK
ncbi:hypothetical protein EST38_g10957 [Candolleomyces aberdarensis]|uniref:Uncharacterized protein n=1 Tax=Candolleomyces aberdarensis TaxID=2316362 RepID=A0A4Q2D8E2_9AGAR|nr:hypothetical protein EST38_g10957 [Candolleomyces aberdarensis]